MKSKLSWLEAALLIAPFLVLIAYWNEFPQRVAIHWNLQGEINGWASKEFGLLLAPLLSLGLVLLLRFVPRLDPKLRHHLNETDRMVTVLQILRLALAGFCDIIFCVIVGVALGHPVAVARIGFGSILLLLAVAGNYLGNLRPNYFVGIRTPWTLENPETWRATHRLGGRLMFFGGLILFIVQFVLPERIFAWLFVVAILSLAIWGFVYSWHHCRTHVPPH